MYAAAPIADDLPASCARACTDCVVREHGICHSLDGSHLAALQATSRWRQLQPGDAVFREGDPASQVASVKSGVLRLTRLLPDGRRHITGFLFPGDFVGLTLEKIHSHTAEAVNEALLCMLPQRSFDAMRRDMPELDRQLYRRTVDELVAAHNQMLSLGRKSATEKVATFLLDMAARTQQMPLGPCRAFLPMPRTDIADYLGLRLETVSRAIGTLKSAGQIRLVSVNEVLILHPEALRQQAECESGDC